MPVYLLHSQRTEPFEVIQTKEKLQAIAGKFLYFAPARTLVIADSLDLYHKDIFLYVQSASFRGKLPLLARPTGYGRLEEGRVCSWISQFFGETPAKDRTEITELLSGLS